jgi:AcrR family transcriptional regulator
MAALRLMMLIPVAFCPIIRLIIRILPFALPRSEIQFSNTMNNCITPQISIRKQPRQARSRELVDTILEAAVQVLKKEGAQRFTTARVAERAGASVGSLYQYFPNKAAILFRLQVDEWRENAKLLREILKDGRKPPLNRLRRLVHSFIQSECAEAEVRVALNDAAPLYRDAPETREARRWEKVFRKRRGTPQKLKRMPSPWPICSAPTSNILKRITASIEKCSGFVTIAVIRERASPLWKGGNGVPHFRLRHGSHPAGRRAADGVLYILRCWDYC